jgi:hypothetical protein
VRWRTKRAIFTVLLAMAANLKIKTSNTCVAQRDNQARWLIVPGRASYISQTPPIPDPESYALLLAGLGVVTLMTQRSRRQNKLAI